MSPVSGEGSDDSYYIPEPEDEPGNGNEIWEENNGQPDGTKPSGSDPLLPWETNLRLPRSVIPVHYDLYLFPDLNNGMFSGKCDSYNHAPKINMRTTTIYEMMLAIFVI